MPVSDQLGRGTGHRFHEFALIDRREHDAPDRGFVEWRIEAVEAHDADRAGMVLHDRCQPGLALQCAEQIDRRVLPPVELAGAHCRRLGRRVGNHGPIHAVEVHDLRPRGHFGGTVRARNIFGKPLVGDMRTGHAFGCDEAVWAGADHLGDLLHRVGLREAFRHDAAHAGGHAERVRQQREWLLEPEADLLVRWRGQLVGRGAQHAAEPVALPPALDARDAIARQHGVAVVELQAVAQRDVPLSAIGACHVARRHLRMRLEVVVLTVQRVEHQVRVVARHIGGGPDRIERGQVGLRDELQHPLRFGRHDVRCCEHCRGCERRFENVPSPHDCPRPPPQPSPASRERWRTKLPLPRSGGGLGRGRYKFFFTP